MIGKMYRKCSYHTELNHKTRIYKIKNNLEYVFGIYERIEHKSHNIYTYTFTLIRYSSQYYPSFYTHSYDMLLISKYIYY